MKNMIIKSSMVATLAAFSFAVALPAVASAQSDRAQEARAAAQERKEASQATAADKKETAQTRSTEAKLKACQKREKSVTNIMTRIANRGQKQVDLFTKIADRTQAFYVDKGKTLDNYDRLVADVAAKKTSAQSAVDTTKATSVEFKCDGTDPKGAGASFQEQMKTQNGALKAYKTAVKNLIVGVKSVQGTTSSTETKPTGGTE